MTAVETGRAIAWIPAAVAAEIALLRERERIAVGVPQLRTAIEQTPGLQFLTLDLRQVEEFASLTAIKDPFDRLIISACRVTGAQLISRDTNLTASKIVRSLWD
jgi:PIN domain nuclease of toxin-antitoxin system